jgi:pimeloyl-ACP methyl ester carboxylesterase
MYVDDAMRKVWKSLFVQWHVQPDGSHLSEKWKKFSDWTPEPAFAHRMVRDLLRAGETSEYGHFAALEYRMEDRLPLVNKPALLIYGNRDPFVQAEKNRIFHDTLSVREELFLDGGVFLPNEAAQAYAEAILKFV